MGHSPTEPFPLEAVAQRYAGLWYREGGAFCGGRTCRKAFAVKAGSEGLAARMQVGGASGGMAP